MPVPPDTVGRYRVERLIAHGGMGSLYLARDPAIDRLVVIKFLKEGFDDPSARERFAREARAAGRLHHPNIVTVFDVGEHDTRPFIAMEYVSGETLAQLIGRRAISRISEKLAILEELCAGLHFAHGAAIVHRDIKPANVMLDESGTVKILDFGIARGSWAGLTRAGDVVGTLNYMAPEQLAGEPVDHRADIYAVGAVAYELITHQMAFPGTVETGVLARIFNSGAVPIASLVPGIDPEIAAMIERTLAREPAARYQDLDALREDLAVVRARLLDTAADLDQAIDPDAETRFDSARIGSGRSSSASATLRKNASARSARRSGQVSARPRRTRSTVILGVAGATLAIGLASAWLFDRFPVASPPVRSETPGPQAQPTPSPTAPPPAGAPPPDAVTRTPSDEISAARVTARQQIVAGQRQRALETLIRGLALDGKDPELNRLLDVLGGAAQRAATEAGAAAVVRGARATSSPAFREGQARERDAGRLLRAGDRVQGIRAAWTAAAAYDKAPEMRGQKASAAPDAAPPAGPRLAPVDPGVSKPVGQPIVTAPSPELLKTLPAPLDKPSVPPPPPAVTAEPPAASRDPAPDPHAADLSAIRDTLRRYAQAYQSLDDAAVGRIMPSLTAAQLGQIDRDFSNYRRYTVDIKDESIKVDGATATVTCQVTRSFETKNGVTSSDTRRTMFRLRRIGAGWTIAGLESR
jgi:serine/threonine protein kinase